MVCGSADRYAQHRATTAAEALAELREVLADVPRHRRQEVLDEAAARYARPAGEAEWYFAGAFALLVQAGADAARARAIWDARPRKRGLLGLGEQGGKI